MTSSTMSSESAPRSSTNEALLSTWLSSTPNCSTIICFTFCSTNAMHFLLGYANALILAAFAEISQVMGRMTRPGPMQLAHGTIRKLHSATFHAGTSVLACHRRGRRREHLERWLKSTSGGAIAPTRASLKPFRSNRLHLVKQMHWVAASKANEGPKYATHLANCDNSRNCIQPRVGANPRVAPRRRSGARRSTGAGPGPAKPRAHSAARSGGAAGGGSGSHATGSAADGARQPSRVRPGGGISGQTGHVYFGAHQPGTLDRSQPGGRPVHGDADAAAGGRRHSGGASRPDGLRQCGGSGKAAFR